MNCLCAHPCHGTGSRREPCSVTSCGCHRYRPDPRAGGNPFAALELYPDWMAACPHCDSPYGTVHGPDCPFDPVRGEIAARGEAGSRRPHPFAPDPADPSMCLCGAGHDLWHREMDSLEDIYAEEHS